MDQNCVFFGNSTYRSVRAPPVRKYAVVSRVSAEQSSFELVWHSEKCTRSIFPWWADVFSFDTVSIFRIKYEISDRESLHVEKTSGHWSEESSGVGGSRWQPTRMGLRWSRRKQIHRWFPQLLFPIKKRESCGMDDFSFFIFSLDSVICCCLAQKDKCLARIFENKGGTLSPMQL